METTLGEVCSLYSGTGFPVELQGKTSGKYPFYKVGDISRNVAAGFVTLNSCDNYVDDKDLKQLRGTVVPKGTIVFAKIGEAVKLNRRAITVTDCLIDNNVIGVKPNDEVLSLQYCYYLLTNLKMERYAESTTVPSVKKSILASIRIDVPSTQSQVKICSELDLVNKLISLRKKQLQKLDDLVKSRFVEMFGDYDLSLQKTGWYKVSQIGTVVGGSTPKTNVPEYWNGEYRWVSPAELKMDSGVIFDSEKKITKAGIESCSLQELPIGTVILSSRAPIGKVAIAGNTFYCNQGFKNIICSTKVKPRFLYTLLLYNTEYLNSLGRGATFKEISKSIVEEIRIPVPPIKDQERFVQYNDKIDGVRRCLKQGHDKLEQMKQALMQKYFG